MLFMGVVQPDTGRRPVDRYRNKLSVLYFVLQIMDYVKLAFSCVFQVYNNGIGFCVADMHNNRIM